MEHSIEELKRQLATKQNQVQQLSTDVRRLQAEIAERESEFKIGDTIIWKFGDGRRKGIVLKVLTGGHLTVRGIRKDGSEGAIQKAYSWDKIERAEVQA